MLDRNLWLESYADKIKLLVDYVQDLRSRPIQIDLTWEVTPSTRFETPRESLAISGSLPMESFYFVDYVCSRSRVVYDIGCGSNIFKVCNKNIVGVDPNHSNADITDKFNDEYAANHANDFPGAVAINSLHYVPFEKLGKVLEQFVGMIVPGGFGYIAFNFQRIADFSDISREDNPAYSIKVDQLIENMAVDVLHYENKIVQQPDEHIDGNIKLLFRKRG